ncbi:MAG: hypothetical protein WC621_00175 [Patescibacteria group bacterium]
MSRQIKFDHKREYDWLIIAQSYLQCALISARILSKRLNKFAIAEGSPLEYCLKEIYGNYSQEPVYLMFPILFNFKHGIEIYLKAIIGITNSKFPKNHNLLDLLEKAGVENKTIKNTIEKYAFGNLFLLDNKKCDIENQFERYPQGSPYDKLELFQTIDGKGKTITLPEGISLDGYLNLIKENSVETISIISQEKINELIKDIEFLYENIRQISLNLNKNSNISFLA